MSQEQFDMNEAMAKWQEACTPGRQHKALNKFVGRWKKFMYTRWFPGEEAKTHGPGEAVVTSIHAGRYIQLDEKMEMMGQPYDGLGFIGYDNFKGKYSLYWCDSLGTAASFSYGVESDGGNTLVFHGVMDEPMTGERDKPIRLVYRWLNDNERAFEIWDLLGTDREFKPIEITYTRMTA